MCRDTCGAQQRCLNPDDCHAVEPPVHPGNAAAWHLYKVFDKQWEWGSGGYRLHFNYEPLMKLAEHIGIQDDEMFVLVEHVKVIESAVLENERDRCDSDQQRRELEQKRNANPSAPQRRVMR